MTLTRSPLTTCVKPRSTTDAQGSLMMSDETTMSAIDPTVTGALMATPSNRPRYSGSALVVETAAPVDVGMRFAAPDMSLEVQPLGEGSRALQHDVYVQRFPRETRRVAFAQQRD